MKILFFVRDLMVGGSQRQLALLAKGLAQRGHDVSVAVLYAGGPLERMIEGSGVRLLAIGKSGRWHIAAPLTRLRRLFVDANPDILYAFLPTQTALAALLLPRGLRTKLVFGLRAGGMQLNRYGALEALTYRLEARLSGRADLIIANARSVRADAIGRRIPGERIAVIPNGIDTDVMRPDPTAGHALRRAWSIPDGAFVVGCVARLDPMKNHPTFFSAAAQFSQNHPDAYFVCVGNGPTAYSAQLKARAQAFGLGGRMHMVGEIADMRAAYNAFDIVTLSSAFGEGFPNVVGESMACGVPVVATDVGDTSAVIGPFGELAPPNDPAALCAGWVRLGARLAIDQGLPEAARAFIAANFSVDAMVRRSERALFALVSGRDPDKIAREFP